MVIVRHLATSSAVGLFAAKVRFTYRKCKNIVKKVANGAYMYANFDTVWCTIIHIACKFVPCLFGR